ncbi:MAG: DinB family protein [Chloroflexota bacterium]|nr:DinB family protein [Chloroflexota bacterium]
MDDPLLELTPGPTLPVASAVVAARAAVRAAIDDLLTVPDAALESVWEWRAGFVDDTDVRYAFYRIHERLEESAAAIVSGRAGAGEGPGVGPAVPLFGPLTAARWELRAALAPLQASDLDADPGGGEWTVRRTLGHTVGSQRGYGWYNAWWLRRGHAEGPLPTPADDPQMPPDPDDDQEGVGSPTEIMARLDDLADVAAGRFAALTEDELTIPARWSGVPVDLRFRMLRLGSHIREHTVQVDKTLAMTGRQPTEVERLVRLIGASYGRLESLVYARSDEVLGRRFGSGTGSARHVLESAHDVAQLAHSARTAAAAS